MNMKRIILFALVLCLMLCASSVSALAVDSPAPDGFLDRFRPLLDDGLDALTDWLGGQTDKLPPELRETLRDADADALFSDLLDLVGQTRGMDDEELREAVLSLAEKHGVHLVDRQVAQLMKLCRTLEKLDTAQLRERTDALKEALDDAAPTGLRGVWQSIVKAVTDAVSWIARTVGGWFNTNLPLKEDKDLRGCFSSGKAEDAGGLAPAKDDNAAWRKADRKDCLLLMGDSYKI